MYRIYADGVCFYNDAFIQDDMKVSEPKLTMEDNAAGSLSITIPPTNLAYDKIVCMATDISVTKDNEEIWAGRVLSEDKDFWNNRVLLCEGELAFFNDTTQPPADYTGKTVQEFLEAVVSIHNSKVAENRQFTVGTVTVTDSNTSAYRYTNYDKTIDCINDQLVDQLGGHLRVRKVNGVRYLDYLADYPNTCTQTIEFGKNLLDFTRQWDLSEFATVILPLGNNLGTSSDGMETYLTVESVNDGSIYVKSETAVAEYGWIEQVVNWNDVSDASTLLTNANTYLADIQFDDMTLELTALDLHYYDTDYETIKLLDKIHIVSRPHGMDRYFPITKLEIPLDEPENTTFTLGTKSKTTLSSTTRKTSSQVSSLGGSVSSVQADVDDLTSGLEELEDEHGDLYEYVELKATILDNMTAGLSAYVSAKNYDDTLGDYTDKLAVTKLMSQIGADQASLNLEVSNQLDSDLDGSLAYSLAELKVTIDGTTAEDGTVVAGLTTKVQSLEEDNTTNTDAIAELNSTINDASSGLVVKVSKVEDTIDAHTDAIAELTTKIGNVSSGLSSYVKVSDVTTEAGAYIFVKSTDLNDEVDARIGIYSASDGTTSKTLAEIVADIVSIQGNINVEGKLYINGDYVWSDSPVYVNNSIVGKRITAAEDIYFSGIGSFTPTDITSTTGTATVLGAA